MIHFDSAVFCIFLPILILINIISLFLQHKSLLLKFIVHFLRIGIVLLMVTNLWFMWKDLHRFPIQNPLETEMLISFIVFTISYLLYLGWKDEWLCLMGSLVAFGFLIHALYYIESSDKNLVPELLNNWYIPHILSLVLSYTFYIFSFLICIRTLFDVYVLKIQPIVLHRVYILLYVGGGLLSLGILFGILWAKEAYGLYWVLEPKEIWSFFVWLVFLIYIHLVHKILENSKIHLWILTFLFMMILAGWIGINFNSNIENLWK